VNGLTWRALNKEGCEIGRFLEKQVLELDRTVDKMSSKMDRLTWALVGAAITFGTAAVMLALNLLVH